jgi:hypothetical protein
MPVSLADLIRSRLANQRLSRSDDVTPADAVTRLCAVQAQDYPAARWALGLRVNGVTDAGVERAFDEGTILRTHVLRPTWHFVTPRDIRWLLGLTGPRVLALNAYWCRKNGLDRKTLTRARGLLERTLRDGAYRTRPELAAVLDRAGIAVRGQGLAYVMMDAELEQVVCSGPRRGKQFAYALLDERAPKARVLTTDEALGEITRRFFTSHGPATMKDFVWWSGLTVADVRRGIEIAGRSVVRESLADLTYWHGGYDSRLPRAAPSAHLLPNYDEYLIAYKDRGHVVAAADAERWGSGANAFAHWLVIDGRFAGIWRRVERQTGIGVTVVPFRPLTGANRRALVSAARRYSRFLNVPVELSIDPV